MEDRDNVKDDINVIDLAKYIWQNKMFIVKTGIVFCVFGLIIAFTTKIEFETNCRLLPESNDSPLGNLGGLGGLAGLAGFDLGSGTAGGAITPDLYPQIAYSKPFLSNILNEPLHFEAYDSAMSSYVYFLNFDSPSLMGYVEKYTIGLPYEIKKLFKKKESEVKKQQGRNFIYFSKEEFILMDLMRSRIQVYLESETGALHVTTKMPDATAASELTEKVIELLIEEITRFRIEKSKAQLEFVGNSFERAKKEFEERQNNLAVFKDKNRITSTAASQTRLERLQSEYDVAFEVYKGLASQLEQAKIELNKDKPVFTVLEPVIYPVERSEPRRGVILVLSVILSGFVSIGILSVRFLLK